MKVEQIFEMAVMKRSEAGFGLSQYVGKNFALAGGYRSGSSPAGTTRLRYEVYDLAIFNTQGEEEAMIGFVELFVDGGNQIKGLVNIDIRKKSRGNVGRELITDIVDTAGGELEVHDIQPKARGFWEKMGIEYHTRAKIDGVIRR